MIMVFLQIAKPIQVNQYIKKTAQLGCFFVFKQISPENPGKLMRFRLAN